MSNLALWKSVERTDPAHTKPITGKAYKGNSPRPHHLVYRATEAFGPCGIGWGFEIVEEKVLDGHLIEPSFYERIHMARVRVWYEWEGKRGTVEHVGQTTFSGRRNDGRPYTDEDAPKKSVTDALVKALSMIGFAGDIFLGRYDDSKYVAEVKREIAAEHAAPERDESTDRYIADCRRAIAEATDVVALREWWQLEAARRRAFDLTKAEEGALAEEARLRVVSIMQPAELRGEAA